MRRKVEESLGVPEPPTKRETSLLPVLGVPFAVEVWLFSGDGGDRPVGVAVARDILVVLTEWVRCRSFSVIALAEWREFDLSREPFVDDSWLL